MHKNTIVVISALIVAVLCLCTGNFVIQLIGLVTAPIMMVMMMERSIAVEYTPTHYKLIKGFLDTGTSYSIKSVQKVVLRRYSYIARGGEDSDDTREVIFQVYLARKKKYDKVFTSSSLSTARKEAEALSERYSLPLEGVDIPDME